MTLDDILLFVLDKFGPFTASEQDLFDFIKERSDYKVYVKPDPDTLTVEIGVEEVGETEDDDVSGESGE